MIMLANFNGIKRTEDNFRKVFKEADERFEIESLKGPPGSSMNVICVSWKSSA